jgi:hypothetical protein
MQNKGKKPNKKGPTSGPFHLTQSENGLQIFLKIREPFVPPNPKELHSVYSRPVT